MDIVFTAHGWDDFTYWVENNSNTAIKIQSLLKEIKSNPFKGSGKPEPLKHGLKGFCPDELQVNTDWSIAFQEKKVLIKSVL